jgi:membrane-associated phospholipid phosphatase
MGFGIYDLINFQANFFFSGHTGLPFLMALIFWADKFWRKFFLAVSALFAISVLLAHVHYSVDVFAAPFMTYGIFKIAERFFPYDRSLMPSAADS